LIRSCEKTGVEGRLRKKLKSLLKTLHDHAWEKYKEKRKKEGGMPWLK